MDGPGHQGSEYRQRVEGWRVKGRVSLPLTPGVRSGRYGRLTVVESPDAEMTNVPAAVEL
jgi:hypothetical protein